MSTFFIVFFTFLLRMQTAESNVNCTVGQDCIVDCGSASCGSAVHCADGYDCFINCMGLNVCDGLHIKCNNAINCEVICDGLSTDSPCSNINIDAATATDLTFSSTCGDSTADTQCATAAFILCPNNGNCNALCESGTSCYGIAFHASNAASFQLTSKGQYIGVADNIGTTVVYCPTTNSNCFITGYSGASLDGLTVHAPNNFNDIDIKCIGNGACFNTLTFYCASGNCAVDSTYLNACDSSQLATACDVPMDYIFVNTGSTWKVADDNCFTQYGTHLASIRSQAEYDAVHALASGNGNTWIGLNDRVTEGIWNWSDPDTECVNGNCQSYSWWHVDEPDGGDTENCGVHDPEATANSAWYDDSCASIFKSICNARSRTPAPTTAIPTSSRPTTTIPTTSFPTTNMPTTLVPTSQPSSQPTTSNPTTSEPTTSEPTSSEPTSTAPTSTAPTSTAPTTSEPTTGTPTTSEPTSNEPTSSEPTTSAPSTSNPVTSAPLTSTPVTYSPTKYPLEVSTGSPTNDMEAEESTATTGSHGALDDDETNDSFLFGDSFMIVIIVAGAFIICIIILLLCYCKKKRKEPKQSFKSDDDNDIDTAVEMERITSTSSNHEMTHMVNSVQTAGEENMQTNNDVFNDPYSDDLKMWLTNIQLDEYYDLFIEQGFGNHISALSKLTNDDLIELGVNKMAHRKVILTEINSGNARSDDNNINIEGPIQDKSYIDLDEDDDDDNGGDEQLYTNVNSPGNFTTTGGYIDDNMNNANDDDEDDLDEQMYKKGGGVTSGNITNI